MKLIKIRLFFYIGLIWMLVGCSTFKAISVVRSGHITEEGLKSTPLTFEMKSHLILVKVKLNDTEKFYSFILDTGAMTIIDERLMDELSLTPYVDVYTSDTTGKEKQIHLVKLKSVRLGDAEVKDCGAGVYDLTELGVDGIIGSNFFKHFKVTIDYSQNQITFSKETKERHPKVEDELRFEFDSSFPTAYAPEVECRVNNEMSVNGLIDTGIDFLGIPAKSIDELTSFQQKQYVACKGGCAGSMLGEEHKNYLMHISSFVIGNTCFGGMVGISSEDKFGNLLIGRDFLSKFVTVLDYPNGEMILVPISKLQFNKNYASFGIALRIDDEKKVKVSGVWQGSSADKNGMKRDDEILMIQNQSASTLSILDIAAILNSPEIQQVDLMYQRNGQKQNVSLTKHPLLPKDHK
ncbi:MAG: aspartyl protease family protein [Myxococcota bacterium]|nr:aspartyl protease family protein [Myxococcota bacterium]